MLWILGAGCCEQFRLSGLTDSHDKEGSAGILTSQADRDRLHMEEIRRKERTFSVLHSRSIHIDRPGRSDAD